MTKRAGTVLGVRREASLELPRDFLFLVGRQERVPLHVPPLHVKKLSHGQIDAIALHGCIARCRPAEEGPPPRATTARKKRQWSN